MMSSHIDIATWSHDYGESKSSKAKFSPDVLEQVHIERPVVESIPQMSKGSTKSLTINPNAKASLNLCGTIPLLSKKS